MKIVLRERAVKRSEVTSYLTPEFYRAYNLWAKIKRHGWPRGEGWIREPAALVDLVELFDNELEMLRELDANKGRTEGDG